MFIRTQTVRQRAARKRQSYTVKNLTGTLDAVVTRTRMYDQDSKTGNIDKVDYLHLTPYDYVEYTIQVGAPSNALIPLEHTTVDFSVPKGQRIVRWDVVDANGNSARQTADAAENIPAADIHATLSDGGTTIEAAQGVKYALLASSRMQTRKKPHTSGWWLNWARAQNPMTRSSRVKRFTCV